MFSTQRIIITSLLAFSCLTSPLNAATRSCPTLSLETYLSQVQQFNAGLTGSALIASGAAQRTGEGRLIMKPSFFAEGQYLKDNFDPDWSPINGNGRNLQTYKMGVSQNTPYGLQGKLYYNYQHQTINGLSPCFNQTQITASSPIAELNVPLARNFAGCETRASAQLVDSQAQLLKYSQRFKNQMLMAQAESTYWHLAVLRCIIAKQRESLDRAIKIQQWVNNKVQLRLADSADIFQSAAAVSAKRLDMLSTIQNAELAERDFNLLRGACQAEVPEQLCSFHQHTLSDLALPTQAGMRDDVYAAEQEQKIQIANAQLGIERNKPDFSLYASYAFNGNNPSSNQAIAQSFTSNYPSTAVGLRLSMPLDLGRLAQDRYAYKKEIRGAHYQFQQRLHDNLQLWNNLHFKIIHAKKRLETAVALEAIQLKKLQAERTRLLYGKTTTYQALLFEQDYTNAQITVLAIQDEILELMAQLKTFGV